MNHQLNVHVVPSREQETSGAAPVTVNGVEIAAADINLESANHTEGSIDLRQYQAAVALVIRELLRQRAAALGLMAADGELEDGTVEALIKQELEVPEPDEDGCRRYFDNHHERFRSPDLFEVSHILIAADPRDAKGRGEARQKALDAITAIAGDPRRLEKLAPALSDCPSKEHGGDLGQIGKGQTVSEFEDVLFRMQQGELSRTPVESRYGYHIIHLRRRADGKPLPYEMVRGQIAEYLKENVRHRAMHQYLQILIGAADIRGIELEGAGSPLVR